nr:NIPSNAP family protein [Caulobacter sp. 17J80-11]
MRRYTLKPGRRDNLIALFEREFVETQEAAGMTLLGQFRDVDAPDRFVWMRGFPDMERRREALSAFYGGPAWKAHREAANDTMIDSDDVLLLRPAGAPMAVPERATASGEGAITATVLYLAEPADADLKAWFEADVRPAVDVLGAFVTEPAANNFQALPVREGEDVFVWLARGAEPELPMWLKQRLVRPPEVMRLAPTARSRVR